MHEAVTDWVQQHVPDGPVSVLDVGGRDINGSVRALFPEARCFVSVDLHDGPGVDVVGDICTLDLGVTFDVVVCAEVLEHAENWRAIVGACAAHTTPGGRVIITAAGPGRRPHSAIDENPIRADEFYANIEPAALWTEMRRHLGEVVVGRRGDDVRGVGFRP